MPLPEELKPKKIIDLVDRNIIDKYIQEMRKQEDMDEIPEYLRSYARNYFREFGEDKEILKRIALIIADDTYRYAATVTQIDDYTRKYFLSVFSYIWEILQDRKIDTFYILDNELREDRFMLAIQLFALSGVAVVTPYAVKDNYHAYMTVEEQARWALSFTADDLNPKQLTITMDTSEEIRYAEVIDLIKKYIEHKRNIVYIEKDASVNYLGKVIEIGKNSEHFCVFRNQAPDNSEVTIL